MAGRGPLACLLVLSVSACSDDFPPHGNLNSILWVQAAGEYEALTLGTFRVARERLDEALADTSWSAALEQTGDYSALPPAIITDVDETILSNAPFRARLVKLRQGYHPRRWAAWVREAQAPPVPGALEFCRYAAERGVTVLYVTNRHAKLEEATRKNLQDLGFPFPADGADVLLCKEEQPDWSGEKVPRRTLLAQKYRILLMLGDAMKDFLPQTRVANEERRELARKYQDYWAKKWIVLPNPMEGTWQEATWNYARGQRSAQRRVHQIESLDALLPGNAANP